MTALPATLAERTRPQLLAEIERIKALLRRYDGQEVDAAVPATGTGPLDRVVDRLDLTAFERDVLLLAASVELDSEAAELVAKLQGGESRPTFALALASLPDAHWDALLPNRPLRRWGLVIPTPGSMLASRPLLVDEHVLHAITGLGDPAAPGGLPTRADGTQKLTPTQAEVADELGLAVSAMAGPVLVRLDGDDSDALAGVASRLAAAIGLEPLQIDGDRVEGRGDLEWLAMVVDREAALGRRLPVVSNGRLASLLGAPVVVFIGEDAVTQRRTVLARTVSLPEPREQLALWQEALPDTASHGVADAAAEIAQHYRLSARSIQVVASEWVALAGSADDLRRLTRDRARVSLGILAERIEPRASWDDLVLPEGQQLLLKDLVRQVRHRAQVYEEWGFARTSNRGFGVTAMFAGESGTGKTMAAEVIARDLGLDLFRIDLSAVVSKYIGETEKNLRALFDAAEAGGAVLLFDEADALFGKRSDVKDSHDRYANLEVAYLLQRMEAYRGVAILTTNMRSHVDPAFLRRLRFVVQFPFPDEPMRRRIWEGAFPAATPTEGLEPAVLARLQVSGGSIRSIALGAAFAAADAGTPVRVQHVLHAARVEYAKAERTLTEAETRGIGRAR